MTIRGHKDRVLISQPDRKGAFTATKQALFLEHFAAPCNLQESARVAGVSHQTIYNRRYADPAFRDAFARAEENGILSLRAELVRRSLQLLSAATPDEKALAELPGWTAGPSCTF